MLVFLYDLATDKKRGICASTFKAFLYVLSLIYGAVVRALIFIQSLKPYRLNCKVISVGNITLGGTGKTSLVALIASDLKQRGNKIAILSRGYKRKVNSQQSTVNSYESMGDEPYMLSRSLNDIPVLVDRDRISSAKHAIKKHDVDTVILDDGFQQWKIIKDLEIVTIDVTDPFGNRHLLPRGILRQPVSSLSKADILVLTKTNLNPDIQDIKGFLAEINPAALVVEAIHKPLGFYSMGDDRGILSNPDILKAEKVTLFCGIADPDSFENLIASLGIKIGLGFRFSDHHHYDQKDVDKIMRSSTEQGIKTIITTEKDEVRLVGDLRSAFSNFNCYVLRIELEVMQNEAFVQRIRSLY